MALFEPPIALSGHLPAGATPFRLRLTTEFQLLADSTPIRLPHSAERIVSFLALARAPVTRSTLAGTLWPDVSENRANGDLRSTLWRLRRVAPIVPPYDDRVFLTNNVAVDLVDLTDLTREILDGPTRSTLARLPELIAGAGVLPSWDEEWLIVDRERYRALRLHALEHAATALLDMGDIPGALQATLAAITTEPLRESSHRLLVRIHLAEGNLAEASRAYRAYRTLMMDELGIEPSSLMEELAFKFRGAAPRRANG